MNVAIVVLAAGSSSRMGEPKQLLSVNNRTLLEHVLLEAKGTTADKVFCVLGAYESQLSKLIDYLDVSTISNENFSEGLSTSIVCAINVVENEGFDVVLFMLADQPRVDVAYLNKLIEVQSQNIRKIVASSYGKLAGVPVIIPKQYFGQLKKISGDKGAREFLNESAFVLRFEGGELSDLDSPEDYQRYLDDELKALQDRS